MRGKNDNNRDIELATIELYGGIKQQIIFFAAETGISASWIATRLSELLSPERERIQHHLPTLREASTRNSGAMEPLALAEYAHSSGTPVAIEAGQASSNNASNSQVNKKRGNPSIKEYWAAMTKEERQAEVLRRLQKRKNLSPTAAAQLKAMKKIVKANSAVPVKGKSDGGKGKKRPGVDQSAIQKAAWARKKALQAGQRVQVDAKLKEKRRKDRERHRQYRNAQKAQQVHPESNELIVQ